MEETHKYDDIIHLPRPVSAKRARMSMVDRGAQFSPFAALTGYDAVIRESGRLTQENTELDECGIELLDRKLRAAMENRNREIEIVFFQPDPRKDGGSFQKTVGLIRKVDLLSGVLLMEDLQEIPIRAIREIKGVEEDGEMEYADSAQQPEDAFFAD